MNFKLSIVFVCIAFGACKETTSSRRGDQNAAANPATTPTGNVPTATPGSTPGAYSTGSGQRIEFTGFKGDKVPGNLYVPTGATTGQKFAGMLLQPGIGGDKESDYIKKIAALLNPRGVIVLTIDPPGAGERKIPGQSKTDFLLNGISQDLFKQHIEDYRLALNFLLARADVDPARIVYGGASWGAITGIPYAAIDARVKVLVSIVGGGGFFGLVPAEFDPANNIAKMEPRPALLINATNDQVILKPFADAIHNAAGPHAKKVWLNANHTLDGIDQNQLVEIILTFLNDSKIL